jgi:O-antigen biosynthesis protein WbqP
MITYKIIKRAIDIILSFMAMVMLSPILLIIAVLIKIDSKGPVFFKQKRIGKNKKHFSILKFRTMRTDTPKDMPTHMLYNPNEYITKCGMILRKTSLDELPQIINIFKGEMSIIGPRPALWNQYDLIKQRDKYGVNESVPGLTGLAQINGRDELAINVKAKFDRDYVEKMSFSLDAEIFFKTILSGFAAKGIREGGNEKLEHRKATVAKELIGKETISG